MSIVTGRRLNRFFTKISSVFASKSIYGDTTMSLGRESDTTIGLNSVVVGGKENIAKQSYSAVLGGYSNVAGGMCSVVVGGNNNGAGASGTTNTFRNAVVGGVGNSAEGNHSVIIGGYHCNGLRYSVMMGHYNDNTKGEAIWSPSGTGRGTVLEIGNGTEDTASNAVRLDCNGKFWCKSEYSSSGADYAELFEWSDGNPEDENRIGFFVTMKGKKIVKANKGDWILGIVSANPCVLGNSDMEWQGQFLRDEFGAYIIEHYKKMVTETDFVLDDEGKPVINEETGEPVIQEVQKEIEYDFYKVNPDYNPDVQYIDRMSRPEWDAVGMMGVLSVWDDGTCEVDGYCTVAEGGIATKSSYGYRVTERVSDHIVKVVLNCETDTIHEEKILELEDNISRLEQQIQQLLGS